MQEAIDAGARSVREVGDACEAGTDCGGCRRTIGVMIRSAHRGPTARLRRMFPGGGRRS